MKPKGPPKKPWEEERKPTFGESLLNAFFQSTMDHNRTYQSSDTYYRNQTGGCLLQLIFLCFAGFIIYLFIAWLSNYDPNEPVKRCAAYSNDGKLTCLRYEGENVSNGTIDPSDARVKRVKYSDGTYVDYGIDPDEYCPED